jgi:hypothetical protein
VELTPDREYLLVSEFFDLLPERPRPMAIQRFSMRRFGLALLVVIGLLLVVPMLVSWAVRTDRVNTSLYTGDVGCSDGEALWLMAQAVPSASLVPCVQLVPADWSLNDVKVGSGTASIVFDTVVPFRDAAVTVRLTPSCDLNGAEEISSEQPGARRYIRIDRGVAPFPVTRSYVFHGGCITERFVSDAGPQRLASEASSSLGFVTREALANDLSERSGGRLELDPAGGG